MKLRIVSAVALALVGCGLGGCKKDKPADVAPMAAEDANLEHSEQELVGQRGTLQRERKKLADARAEIIDRRQQLGHDSAGQAALDAEERSLLAKEGDLASQESQVNGKLDELLRMRGELVKRVTQVSGVADPNERATRREQGVAGREKDLAKREAEMAERERTLAERESRQARREKETCGTAPVAAPPPLPKGLKYGARDVEPTYRKALRLMQERGLVAADLPPGSSKLIDSTQEAMKKADFVRAKYDAEALLATVEEVKIDRGFISTKMARLSTAMRGRKIEGEQRKSIEGLFQSATADYGDGKFAQANQKINRIFALLR